MLGRMTADLGFDRIELADARQLRPRQNLGPTATTARTTNRTSALYLADQGRGDRVHTELGSRHAHRTAEVGPAALTPGLCPAAEAAMDVLPLAKAFRQIAP